VLTSYGLSSGFCVDPIEKKPLSHFLPGTPVLSFGTAGCNLGCQFCQNWDMSKSREMATLADQASPEQLAQAAVDLACRSVAFTYNDPTVFMEYADDVADACRERGIYSVAVTAGYICPEPRREFYSHMDAVDIDFKGFSEKFYSKICSAHLQEVKETLVYVKQETDVWMEITTLLIPGENDSDQELHDMSAWVVENLGPDVPWHFSAFHPDWKMKDVPATPPATLKKARGIARQAGVRHVYVGNVHDIEADSTYCHACGRLLIGRDWYELTEWNLAANRSCPDCGTVLPGIFEERPGTWGRRRLPVKIG
jgi:pyruvate formate lyase activating enzyme